jgi:hypothetical protein
LTFRLWRSPPLEYTTGGTDIPAELLLKLRFNHCLGGRIECLRRDSLRARPNEPLYFEARRSSLSQTHFRLALGDTLWEGITLVSFVYLHFDCTKN